ncbi:MAG: hypothetical protein BEU05_00665 [Marine Group III euryarchaeote CG-Bathy2]|uniref:Uncharacterized protein n=1 Tax=Marine Group III euryarchaeote CG-Bathy2 TaxID=1889002 RepID=A0A1J5TBT9_9ARCH|nr:MAG: hypothetical protein BEU05_00665 [Marine Group III euryarchaeote CG-Bathy2]
MRAIAGILMLALLLVATPAAAKEEEALALELDFSSPAEGTALLQLAWDGGPDPPEALDWSTLRAHYADKNFSLSESNASEAVLRYLTAPMPEGNSSAVLAGAILGSGAVAEAEVSSFSTKRGLVELGFEFRLDPGEPMHPLMFATQLENASGMWLGLTIHYPPDAQLATDRFVLDHLRLPTGGWMGGLLPATSSASYDPGEGEISLATAPQWADGRVMAVAVVLQLLLIVAISYRYGSSLLRPLAFGGAALLAYLFVSFPFSTGLCYTIILFGLARQYLGALTSRELRRDMDGFVDTLLTRPRGVAAASGGGAALEELRASRNPLARLFPFKIQELFLIYDDGRLISHSTLHGSRTVDSEIVSSMLTAIGDFIKDSFRADDKGSLENLKYGNINLYVQRREPLYLAGVISGTAPDDFGTLMKEYLDELWGEYGYVIGRSWNGDTSSLGDIRGDLAEFIHYWSSSR